jgi:hypothetical protein
MGKGIPLWIVHTVKTEQDGTQTLIAKVTSNVPFVNFDYENHLDAKSYTTEQSGLGTVVQKRWIDPATGQVMGTDDSAPNAKPQWHCDLRWTIEDGKFVKYLDFSAASGFKKQYKLVHNRK